MGNCISYNNITSNIGNQNTINNQNNQNNINNKSNINNKNNECLICWNEITSRKHYVKCKNCKIYLHNKCITSFILFNININNNNYTPVCPHCQKQNVLYLYYDDDCIKL